MKEMIRLAWPVSVGFLGMMLMGMVDLLAVGRVSAEAVGSVGVGVSLFSWFMMFGLGFLTSLDYLVGFAHGAGRGRDGHVALVQSLWLCLILGVPMTALMVFMGADLSWMGVNPKIRPGAESYFQILGLSLVPLLIFSAFRQYLQAVSVPYPPMVFLLVGNVLNGVLNYAFVFGKWGFEPMGAVGTGWATLLTRTLMMLGLGLYIWRWDLRNHRYWSETSWRVDPQVFARILRLGFPASLQLTFEVGVFALATILAARLATNDMAAHQIVLNLASMTFMVPMGISAATAVLVGQAMGRGNPDLAFRNGWSGLSLSCVVMLTAAIGFLSFPESLIRLYTSDSAVISIGKPLLLIAALFQLFDGLQVVGTGALRGVGDTKTPMLANLVGHWGIGLPLGYVLCFVLGWGVRGLWVGLALGLFSVALALLLKWMSMGEKRLKLGVACLKRSS